jgi:hypothetical protein
MKKKELKPWVDKVKAIATETTVVRVYLDNHAIEFKQMLGTVLSDNEQAVVKNEYFKTLNIGK